MERGLKSRHSDHRTILVHPGTLQWTWQIRHVYNRKYYKSIATLIPECHRPHQTTAPNVLRSSINFLKTKGEKLSLSASRHRQTCLCQRGGKGERETTDERNKGFRRRKCSFISFSMSQYQCGSCVRRKRTLQHCCKNASSDSGDTINEALHHVECPPGDGVSY